jgi:hypothetical protein
MEKIRQRKAIRLLQNQCDDECCVSAEDCHITSSLASGTVDCEEPKQDSTKDWKELEDAKLCEPLKSWDEPKQKNQDYIDDCFRVLSGKEPIYEKEIFEKEIFEKEILEEVTKNIDRTKLFDSILSIVKQIPRENVEDDAMDAPSCTYEIEQLFYKFQAGRIGLLWKAERMYSDDEVLEILKDYNNYQWNEDSFNGKDRLDLKEWFEQNKKH